MNVHNFVVRPNRRLVEQFRSGEAWRDATESDFADLANNVAGLPTELPTEPEEAKRFDVLILGLQMALLQAERRYAKLRDQVKVIASRLEEYPTIPGIAVQMELILDLQGDEWWEGVTVSMLESVRKRLRLLVQFIEKRERRVIYTDFEDERGEEVEIEFGDLVTDSNFEQFRKKARAFLRSHDDDVAIMKVRHNWPLTPEDIADLEQILLENRIGSTSNLQEARTEAGSLGLFVRSLVGLDRTAAKEAFVVFLDERRYSARQIEFVNLIIDDLTQNGVVEPRRIYESPFTEISAQGPDGLFSNEDVDRLIALLGDMQSNLQVA